MLLVSFKIFNDTIKIKILYTLEQIFTILSF